MAALEKAAISFLYNRSLVKNSRHIQQDHRNDNQNRDDFPDDADSFFAFLVKHGGVDSRD